MKMFSALFRPRIFYLLALPFVSIALSGCQNQFATSANNGGRQSSGRWSTHIVDSNAQQRLEQSVAAYQQLKAYSDTTEIRVVGANAQPSSKISIAWAQPAKLAVIWNKPTENVTRISNEETYFEASSKHPKKYLKKSMPPRSYGRQALIQYQAAGRYFSLFLAGVSPLKSPHGSPPTSLSLAHPSVIDGVPVDIVVASYDDEATKETVAYEMGQKDHLLRRIVVTTGAPGKTTTTVETHSDVKINPALPASTFNFTPPAGAQAVKQFEASRWDARLKVGASPIAFSAVDTQGRKFSLEQAKSKATLLVFWASWCHSCRSEMPYIVQAYKKYHPQGLEVVGVSLDTELEAKRATARSRCPPGRCLVGY